MILNNKFYKKPRFSLIGAGGEYVRAYPTMSIKDYIKKLTKNIQKIKGHEEEFYKSSINIFNRSIYLLKKEKII